MRSRKLNKRIDFYQTASVSDGYGGFTTSNTLLTTSWASLQTQTSEKVSDLGLDYTKGNIAVTIREREDLSLSSKSNYFMYRGVKYTITSFPTNTNFTDGFITFFAQAEKPD